MGLAVVFWHWGSEANEWARIRQPGESVAWACPLIAIRTSHVEIDSLAAAWLSHTPPANGDAPLRAASTWPQALVFLFITLVLDLVDSGVLLAGGRGRRGPGF